MTDLKPMPKPDVIAKNREAALRSAETDLDKRCGKRGYVKEHSIGGGPVEVFHGFDGSEHETGGYNISRGELSMGQTSTRRLRIG